MAITSNAPTKPKNLATEKDKKGHMEASEHCAPGNMTVWCTAVLLPKRGEFQNRFLVINPDESEEADKRAIEKTTERISMGLERELPESYRIARAISQILMERVWRVLIPYGAKIVFSTRDRRIPNFILAMIKASAIVHQFRRATFKDLLFASIEDYEIAMELWGKIGVQSSMKLSEKELKILDILPEGKPTDTKVKCSDIMKKLGNMPRSTTKDYLQRLYEKGLINKEQEEERRNSPYFYWKVNGVNGGLTKINPITEFSRTDLKEFLESFVGGCRKNRETYTMLLKDERIDYIYRSLKKSNNQKSLQKKDKKENKLKKGGKPVNERDEISSDLEKKHKGERKRKIDTGKVNELNLDNPVNHHEEERSQEERMISLLKIISELDILMKLFCIGSAFSKPS